LSAFTLNIAIDATDLAVINLAGESLTIVLGVTAVVTSASKVSAAQPGLVWLAFAPFENNVISFSDSGFLVYAAATMPAPGAVIQVGSQAPAVAGMVQAFQTDGIFGPAQSGVGLGQNTIAIDNLYTAVAGYTAFGLSLPANVNGLLVATTPLIARVTPNMQQVQFSPNYGVQVFLQTGVENAMVLPNSIAGLAVFQLSAAQTTLNLKYNAKIGSFQ
jgi:hypothetical protein